MYLPDELAWELAQAYILTLGHTADQTVREDGGLEKLAGLAPGWASSVAITVGMHWRLLIRKGRSTLVSLLENPLCLLYRGESTWDDLSPCSIVKQANSENQ